jgi:hypothetical protein
MTNKWHIEQNNFLFLNGVRVAYLGETTKVISIEKRKLKITQLSMSWDGLLVRLK